MSQDIQRKANDMGFLADATTELLSHVSGTKSGPTFFEGMIDCNSESEFEAKLLLVEAKWRHYEQSRSMRGGQLAFFDWFKRYHAEEIKCSMLRYRSDTTSHTLDIFRRVTSASRARVEQTYFST